VLIRPSLSNPHPHSFYPLVPTATHFIRLPPSLVRARRAPCRFLSPSLATPHALAPCVAHLRCLAWLLIHSPLSQRALIGLSLHALPPLLPAPRAFAPCAAHLRRSLPRRASVTHHHWRAADTAMAAGAHVLWRLRSSSAKPRAPTSLGGAGGYNRTDQLYEIK
jgi:hypothetical protein